MKHIKTFSQLNESKGYADDIMDAIINTPEGKDLCALLNADLQNIPASFKAVNTGKVYILSVGSKTYMKKTDDGRYLYESLSNGVPFGTEYFGSVEEMLRGVWLNIIGKSSAPVGIPKKNIMKWVSTNITPGSGMSFDEIRSAYINKTGSRLPDINLIKDHPIFNILRGVYLTTFEMKVDQLKSSIKINFNMMNPFGIFTNVRQTLRKYIEIKSKISKEESHTNVSGITHQIILTRPDSILSDFNDIMSEKLRDFTVPDYHWMEKNQTEMCNGILLALSESMKSDDDLNVSIYKFLANIRNSDPILFSGIIDRMDKAGVFPEITQKFKESDSRIIRSGKMLRGLGI